jgi:hypothetical protein
LNYFKKHNNYDDFAEALNKCDNKVKGNVSEEYWLRWLHYTPIVSNYIKIHNTNDPKSIDLIDKWPELSLLKVGQPNSALVDLLIEYENGYDVVQCKWYADGLSLKDIGVFYTVTNDHLPNCRNKYLTTTAPRTSKFAQALGKLGKDVITIWEDDFRVDNDIWQKISCWKKGEKIVPTKWNWRTKREQESFIKLGRSITKNGKTVFQGPPGWGKTFLMYRLERYLHRRSGGGITVNMADSVISLKQNYLLFNTQDSAIGISRPNLVICKGADDGDLVDWPCEVVGNEPHKILSWVKKNPMGRIFCFYGNTKSLEAAVQTHLIKNPDFEFTSAMCDEASRTCQMLGSGWSHIVHDKCIPVKYRGFFDATPRTHSKYGMNKKNLYGPYGDVVTQPESEKWGSTSSYEIHAMAFGDSQRAQRLARNFEERELVIGKSYTVEDYCMAIQILESKANDSDDQHTIQFGITIKRLKLLKEATKDALKDLLKAYPNSKKIQSLKGIELFVADTHTMSTSVIHRKLNYLYKNKSKSIVYTSRLLYRAWSQVQLDSVYFADNFKGVSYIVQALGRGLRVNPNKPHKICRIYIPVDVEADEPWKILVDLINSIKQWDYRPMESIVSLASGKRKPGKRKPGGGQVYINTSGIKMNASDVLNDLKNVIINEHNEWVVWDQWQEITKIYIKKLETHFPFMISARYTQLVSIKVAKEVLQDDNFKIFIKNEKKARNNKQKLPTFIYSKVWGTDGCFKHLTVMPEWISAKSNFNDLLEQNIEKYQQWRIAQSKRLETMGLEYLQSNKVPYLTCGAQGFTFGNFTTPLKTQFAKDFKFLPGDPSSKKGDELLRLIDEMIKGGSAFKGQRLYEQPSIAAYIDKNYVTTHSKRGSAEDTNLINKHIMMFALKKFIEYATPNVSEVYVEGMGFITDTHAVRKWRKVLQPDFTGGKKSAIGRYFEKIADDIEKEFGIKHNKTLSVQRMLNLDTCKFIEDKELAETFRTMYIKHLAIGKNPIKKQMVTDILKDCIKNKKLFKEEAYKIVPLSSQKDIIKSFKGEVDGIEEYLEWYKTECIRISNWKQAMKVDVKGHGVMTTTEAGKLLGIEKRYILGISKSQKNFKTVDKIGRPVGKVFKYAHIPLITVIEGSDEITAKDIKLTY